MVMAARSVELLSQQAAQLSTPECRVLAVGCDVARESDCKQLMEVVATQFGRLDVLVNNAGISMRALFADLDLDVLKRLMDVNFWGAVYCTKYALQIGRAHV